ncbi:helix-turn-helix domain-containing protein [Litchfieldella rifensis]|uniref:Helix-turn-helix domain-containing protein n=1 Tax=Litchfieldella rifensis TaxID=762643 RepID=A0ABV7LK08_9GAMM
MKQHRKRLGLSQEALAEYCFDRRLCVSIASIKRAESGKAVLYRTARHLAEIYGVEVGVLSVEAEEASAVSVSTSLKVVRFSSIRIVRFSSVFFHRNSFRVV